MRRGRTSWVESASRAMARRAARPEVARRESAPARTPSVGSSEGREPSFLGHLCAQDDAIARTQTCEAARLRVLRARFDDALFALAHSRARLAMWRRVASAAASSAARCASRGSVRAGEHSDAGACAVASIAVPAIGARGFAKAKKSPAKRRGGPAPMGPAKTNPQMKAATEKHVRAATPFRARATRSSARARAPARSLASDDRSVSSDDVPISRPILFARAVEHVARGDDARGDPRGEPVG